MAWLGGGLLGDGSLFAPLLEPGDTPAGAAHAFLRALHGIWDELLCDADNDGLSNSVTSLSSPQRISFNFSGSLHSAQVRQSWRRRAQYEEIIDVDSIEYS